jgi:TPP-dependent indolepyruvate ferredoxin oxidoreductase alpha subunit
MCLQHSKVITIILDNRITGMTGHQQNPGTGYTAQEDPANLIDIEKRARTRNHQHQNHQSNHLNEVNDALDWALALDVPASSLPLSVRTEKILKRRQSEFDCLFTENSRWTKTNASAASFV